MSASRSFSLLLVLFVLWPPVSEARELPATCSYQTYAWNTRLKQAVDVRLVQHDYRALTKEEVDEASGCTVCQADQVTIQLRELEPFQVCHVVAARVREVLTQLIREGEPILKVEGYRVGKTRGEADRNGNRTRFSNHSFGIALDINPEQNGLYDHCRSFDARCRLIRGGLWQPGAIMGSLLPGGPVISLFKQAGFKWGGEIKGRQKDFMHFSPSGY